MSLFSDFLESDDTLRIFDGDEIIFRSDRDRLMPLLDYLDLFRDDLRPVTIFDRIMGNAAALLSVLARGKEVHSPLGSRLAIETLEKYGISYHLTEIVPFIQRPGQQDMCPMESLSRGKQPQEFYRSLMDKTGRAG